MKASSNSGMPYNFVQSFEMYLNHIAAKSIPNPSIPNAIAVTFGTSFTLKFSLIHAYPMNRLPLSATPYKHIIVNDNWRLWDNRITVPVIKCKEFPQI